MVIETKSGSKYLFTVRGGKIHLLSGSREYLIPEIPAISIGNPMEFVGYQLNTYTFAPSEEATYFKSTPVVAVKM